MTFKKSKKTIYYIMKIKNHKKKMKISANFIYFLIFLRKRVPPPSALPQVNLEEGTRTRIRRLFGRNNAQ